MKYASPAPLPMWPEVLLELTERRDLRMASFTGPAAKPLAASKWDNASWALRPAARHIGGLPAGTTTQGQLRPDL